MKTSLDSALAGPERGKTLELGTLSEANSARLWADWLYARLSPSPWLERTLLLWNFNTSWKLLPFRGGETLELPPDHPLISKLSNVSAHEILDSEIRAELPGFGDESTISIIPLKIPGGWTYGALLLEHPDDESPLRPDCEGEIWNLAILAAERLALRESLESHESRAREVEEQQGNFLNIINHELRTPLTAILGFADLAYDLPGSREDDVMRQFIEGIRFSGRNLSQRISELLTMGGISSATLQVESDECPLAELIREFHEDILPDIKGHERVRLPDEAPNIVLRTDGRHFQRILVHLIDNALKFSEPASTVQLDWGLLKGRRATDRGDYLRVDVIDSGLGIPEEARELIFRKFYQIEPSATRSRGGMGLGLTLAKEFTEAMGGKLWMKSEPGQGSTFSFTIPLVV